MKTFLLYFLLIITFTSSAFAQSARSDWSSLRVDQTVSIIQPEFAKQFGPSGIFNICYDEDEFKSVSPVNTCSHFAEIKQGFPNSEIGQTIIKKCTEPQLKDISVPRTLSRDVCKKQIPPTEFSSTECSEWTTITTTLPINYTLDVVNIKTEAYPVFKKGYSIPKCN